MIEQFSDASRRRLREAADAFREAIEQHTAALTDLRGGSSSTARVFELNDMVRRAAAAWDDAVSDHTGTFPIAVESPDDDDAEEDEDEPEIEVAEAVSVVSRWDLAVIDPRSLIAAGRAAHRRLWSDESEEDAVAAIGDADVAQALYALVHEYGEPWFELPGVEFMGGRRAYLSLEESIEPVDSIDEDEDEEESWFPVAPQGKLIFSESW